MSKPDKDIGREAGKLGGYTPSPGSYAPVIRQRQIEIVIVATPRLKPKPRHWYQEPFIKLGP